MYIQCLRSTDPRLWDYGGHKDNWVFSWTAPLHLLYNGMLEKEPPRSLLRSYELFSIYNSYMRKSSHKLWVLTGVNDHFTTTSCTLRVMACWHSVHGVVNFKASSVLFSSAAGISEKKELAMVIPTGTNWTWFCVVNKRDGSRPQSFIFSSSATINGFMGNGRRCNKASQHKQSFCM